MDLSLIKTVLRGNIIDTIWIFLGLILLLVVLKLSLVDVKSSKLIITSAVIVSIIIMGYLGKGLLDIQQDIYKKDFIQYEGEYIHRNGGQREYKTVVIFDENGKEIRLLRSGPFEDEGRFKGEVVYGKRSKIVVSYKQE